MHCPSHSTPFPSPPPASGTRPAQSAGNVIKMHSAHAPDARAGAGTYASLLPPVAQAFLAMPAHTELRAKTLFFLHRLVESLGADVLQLPLVPQVVSRLLDSATAETVTPVVELVNQLVFRCKAALVPLLAGLFPAVVERVFACFAEFAHLGDPAASSASASSSLFASPSSSSASSASSSSSSSSLPDAATSADRRTLLALHRIYFSFLSALFREQCAGVLLSAPIAPHLVAVFQPVVRGCVEPNELPVNKTCIALIAHAARALAGTVAAAPGGELEAFFLHAVTPAALRFALLPQFSAADHGCCVTLDEACDAQVHLCRALGAARYAPHVGALLTSAAFGMPVAAAEQYCALLAAGDAKTLGAYFRGLLPRAGARRP